MTDWTCQNGEHGPTALMSGRVICSKCGTELQPPQEEEEESDV